VTLTFYSVDLSIYYLLLEEKEKWPSNSERPLSSTGIVTRKP
jgi:hypothetical protein